MVLNKLSGNASTLGLVFCVCSSLWKLLWMFSVSLVRQPIYYCFYLNLCLCCPVKPLPKIKLRFGHAHTCLIPFYSLYVCCRLLYIIRVFLYKYVMNSAVAFLVWVWIVEDCRWLHGLNFDGCWIPYTVVYSCFYQHLLVCCR